MNTKTKLGRAAAIAFAVVGMSTLGLAGVASASTATPAKSRIDGCSIQTANGHYLAAVGGGGRADVIHTNATTVGAWEKFSLVNSFDGATPTMRRGHVGRVLPDRAGQRRADQRHDPSDPAPAAGLRGGAFNSLGLDLYDIQVADGHYLTAVNGGGLSSGDTLHTDATRVGSWETFRLTCGL